MTPALSIERNEWCRYEEDGGGAEMEDGFVDRGHMARSWLSRPCVLMTFGWLYVVVVLRKPANCRRKTSTWCPRRCVPIAFHDPVPLSLRGPASLLCRTKHISCWSTLRAEAPLSCRSTSRVPKHLACRSTLHAEARLRSRRLFFVVVGVRILKREDFERIHVPVGRRYTSRSLSACEALGPQSAALCCRCGREDSQRFRKNPCFCRACIPLLATPSSASQSSYDLRTCNSGTPSVLLGTWLSWL